MAMTRPDVGARRGPWIASAALAVAIVAAAGLAVLTLVSAPSSPATASPPGAVPAPPVAAAPASPSPAPPPAGAPATADTAGRALPEAVGTGVQTLYTAVDTEDLAGIEARYSPSTTVDAAPWSQVAPLMADPANRESLLSALREPPERGTDQYRFAAPGGAVVGMDTEGRMEFMRLP